MYKEKITSQNSAAEVDSSKPRKERRRTLRTILAGGVLASGSEALPRTWTKPIVESIVLPVHAQTTGEDNEPEEDNGPIVADCNVPAGCYTQDGSGLYFNWSGGLVNDDVVVHNGGCSGGASGMVYARLVLAPDDSSAEVLCGNQLVNIFNLADVAGVPSPCQFYDCGAP